MEDLNRLERKAADGVRNLGRLVVREGLPSKPLAGRLPLSRTIPQDVHSVMDYATAAMAGITGALSGDRAAMRTGATLMGVGLGTAAITDYRMSFAKLLPIEGHEVADYAWSLTAIAAPFLLGYHRRAPLAAWVHVALGAGMLAASLFTDYRAVRGVSFGRRGDLF